MTRSSDYPPLIVILPKVIADAMKVKKGDRLRIYTDGDSIYLDR
jgi:bifunctional DNA-binding transcriptional regulator/antitoxin component of YhaV-PrlF toxin-antitoxin module